MADRADIVAALMNGYMMGPGPQSFPQPRPSPSPIPQDVPILPPQKHGRPSGGGMGGLGGLLQMGMQMMPKGGSIGSPMGGYNGSAGNFSTGSFA